MKISYQKVNTLYSELGVITLRMRDIINSRKNDVSQLRKSGVWSGEGFNNYEKKFSDFANNFSAFYEEISKTNSVLPSVLKKYQDIDNAVLNNMNNIKR